jgi:uncharacterized coiled-coil protein SlyX
MKDANTGFWKALSLLSVGGLISVGIAWGSATTHIRESAKRLDNLEVRMAKQEEMAARIDERFSALMAAMGKMETENMRSHERIESQLKQWSKP